MKTLLFFLTASCFVLLTALPVKGQKKDAFITPAELAEELTAKCSNDKQKVTAIFRWITANISYNTRSVTKNRNPFFVFDEPDDTAAILKPLNERIAETVLRRRVAICDGYARLFTSLCEHAGIRSEVITGYSRVNRDNWHTKFTSNHKWNAVFIDSAWYLLDATWASGYITYRGSEFIRQYDDRYFLTPPDQFIRDHYPEQLEWAFVEKAPTINEFYHAPFHYTAFVRAQIKTYSPSKGIIDAAPGDSIRFEAESSAGNIVLYVSDSPPAAIEDEDEWLPKAGSPKAVYTFKVTGNESEWLYVVCNGQTIMRYKLNIRKADKGLALRSLN